MRGLAKPSSGTSRGDTTRGVEPARPRPSTRHAEMTATAGASRLPAVARSWVTHDSRPTVGHGRKAGRMPAATAAGESPLPIPDAVTEAVTVLMKIADCPAFVETTAISALAASTIGTL